MGKAWGFNGTRLSLSLFLSTEAALAREKREHLEWPRLQAGWATFRGLGCEGYRESAQSGSEPKEGQGCGKARFRKAGS